MPSPAGLPYLGNSVEFFLRFHELHDVFLSYTERHKPLMLIRFGVSVSHVLVSDAHLARQVLFNPPSLFAHRTSFPIVDYSYARFCGKLEDIPKNIGGVTFTNGDEWKQNRRLAIQCISRPPFIAHSIKVSFFTFVNPKLRLS